MKALVFDREHQEEPPRLTDLDDEAMAVFRALNKENLKFFGTFAPIQELPDIPNLKFVGLYSFEQLLLVKGKGVHVGLSIATFDSWTDSFSGFSEFFKRKIIATISYYESTLELWERVNQHSSNLGFHFRPYSFDWKYKPIQFFKFGDPNFSEMHFGRWYVLLYVQVGYCLREVVKCNWIGPTGVKSFIGGVKMEQPMVLGSPTNLNAISVSPSVFASSVSARAYHAGFAMQRLKRWCN